MNKIYFLIILISFVFIANSYQLQAQTYVGGHITSNTTWTVNGSPYIMNSNITVDSGVTLTIDSGVKFYFRTYITIQPGATFNATGVEFVPDTGYSSGTLTINGNSTIDNCTNSNLAIGYLGSTSSVLKNSSIRISPG